MSDPYVREVGTVAAMDGRKVRVGVDYDSVTIDGKPLSQDAADDLAQLYVSACWQAGQNARRAAEEVHEADGDSTAAANLAQGDSWAAAADATRLLAEAHTLRTHAPSSSPEWRAWDKQAEAFLRVRGDGASDV